MYVVSPNDPMADRNEQIVSFVADAVLLRMAMLSIVAAKDEDAAAFRERFPELFGSLEEDIQLCGTIMGDLVPWLQGKLAGLPTRDYKGKKVAKYLDDDEAREALYDDGLVFRTDYPVDEKTIGDKLKKATTVTEVMRKRRAEEIRTKGGTAAG